VQEQQELSSAQSSLPDAPLAVLATQRKRFQVFVGARSPFISDNAGINTSMGRESPEHFAPEETPSFSALYGAPVVQKESNVFFDKYLYPSLRRQDLQYHPSTNESFLGRVGYAASRLFFTSDNSGKRKLNTAYLFGALASAAASSTTYRLYRTQHVPGIFGNFGSTHPASDTFGNFGSTIGGDTGKKIFQQFWPQIHRIPRGHSLKVLQRVEDRIVRDPTSAALVSPPAR